MSILYGHPESGHTCKVALTLAREWPFWEANRVGLSLPNPRHCLRFDASPGPPAVPDWLPALPRWRHPHDLLREPPH